MVSGSPQFELVLQPLPALDPAALQRLRAVLVGELNLSVEEAREVLAGIRAVVAQSHESGQLTPAKSALQRVGVAADILAVSAPVNPPVTQTESLQPPNLVESLEVGEENETIADKPHSGSDALDQISDLFRHLEEACIVGEGAKLLRELPLASYQQRFSTDIVAPDAVPEPRVDPIRKTAGVDLWRNVSVPELAFTVVFSLALLGLTVWWY